MYLRGHKHSVGTTLVSHRAGPQERITDLTLSDKCTRGARGSDKGRGRKEPGGKEQT